MERRLASTPIRKDVQIIVIDGDSDPATANFENFPGLNAPCTEVIFNKNRRRGYAGIKRARGRWLLFADAEDFFNYCIYDILDEYKHAEADIIFFKSDGIASDDYNGKRRINSYNLYIDKYMAPPSKHGKFLRYKYFSPWAKTANRRLVVENQHSV